MATQYTAGLTTGQVLTAATMNSIGAAWESWTPTYSSDGGTVTTTTLVFAKYARINKILFFRGAVIINNAGTGTGAFYVTMPTGLTPANNTGDTTLGVGREYQNTGFILAVRTNGSDKIGITKYDNATIIATGNRLSYQGFYELA